MPSNYPYSSETIIFCHLSSSISLCIHHYFSSPVAPCPCCPDSETKQFHSSGVYFTKVYVLYFLHYQFVIRVWSSGCCFPLQFDQYFSVIFFSTSHFSTGPSDLTIHIASASKPVRGTAGCVPAPEHIRVMLS